MKKQSMSEMLNHNYYGIKYIISSIQAFIFLDNKIDLGVEGIETCFNFKKKMKVEVKLLSRVLSG